MNGLDHAFLREFGCSCNRCVGQRTTANTSVSLVSLDDNGDKILHHVLFDIGMGVVDSLVDSPYLTGSKARLDWLIISHWHPDHVLDLNRLCETWRRTLKRRGEQWKPIATWCRTGTAEWLKRNHAFEWNSFLKPQLSDETSPPGVKLASIKVGITGLTLTPITVSHCTADIDPANPKEKLYCSASFVIQYEGRKVVLLWDIDNRNSWIENPTSDEQKEAVNLLSGADYLFMDCNTWSVEEPNGKNTGHASFLTVHRYVKALSPRGTTLLVHLSGHEDGKDNPGWGWNDSTWEQKAQEVWANNNLPGRVCVPHIGMNLQL
jgi:ribonuclease BN (tRNA processing enzyme)